MGGSVSALNSSPTHATPDWSVAVFGFPNIIDIRVIDIEAARSTLAIYSRSQYGYYDFGANKWRVEMWLKELVGTLTE